MRVLVVQPNFNPPGGGNAVAAWMLMALRELHDLTALSIVPPDLASINEQFGTSLAQTDATWMQMPPRQLRTASRLPGEGSLLRGHLLSRYARRLREEFDAVISADNECDLGEGSIQYVHYPKFDPLRPDARPNALGSPRVVRAYQRVVALATGFQLARAGRGFVMANSAWTAARLQRVTGIKAKVVFPPAVMPRGLRAWEQRENTVVSLGRFSPEKKLETAISIVESLRARGHDLEHLLIGASDDASYLERLREMASERSWLHIRTDLPRAELVQTLHSTRWGLHTMPNEHFGMAPTEMLRAGMLVFGHDSAGPREILAHADLRFASPAQALAKIGRCLEDEDHREELHAYCRKRADELAPEMFVDEIRRVVLEAGNSRKRVGG